MTSGRTVLTAAAFLVAGCGVDDDGAEPAADQQTAASGQVPFDRACKGTLPTSITGP